MNNSKYKVAFVSKNHPGQTGVGTTAWNQACMMAQRGHKVFLINEGNQLRHEILNKGVNVIQIKPKLSLKSLQWSIVKRIPILSQKTSITPGDIEIIKFAKSVNNTLHNFIDKESIEAVFFTEGFVEAAYWHSFNKCKTFMRFACPRYLFQKIGLSDQHINKHIHRLELKAVHRADKWYTPTYKMNKLASEYFNVEENEISVIPNPININEYCPSAEHSISLSILFVGRFSFEKGADYLIDIIPKLMKEYKELLFTVVGNNGVFKNGEDTIETITKHLNHINATKRFKWIKSCSNSKLPAIYRQHNILVLPSRFDNFSMAIVEAHASRLPVVAFDTGGTPEVVEHRKTGFVIPFGDNKGFEDALRKLIENPELRKELGRAARERAVKLWSFDAVGPKIEAIINEGIL